MSQMQQVIDKCKAVYAIALTEYGVDMTQVRISFDLRGRAAGKAGGKRYSDPVMSNYYMKFNRDMLTREAFDHVLNETVPHEIAHIICFAKPQLGKNHDAGWEKVCIKLGGTGNRTHKEEVVYGNGITYEYTTTRGHQVRLSERKHRAVQQGTVLNYRRGLGTVNNTCAHAVVGVRGRSLAEPVRKVEAKLPVNHPAVIDAARREPVAPAPLPRPVLLPVPNVAIAAGASKASVARSIMLSGHRAGHPYETIISAIMAATGHDRQLARATYKANAPKVGIPL